MTICASSFWLGVLCCAVVCIGMGVWVAKG